MKFNVAIVGGAGHIGLPMSCFIQNKGIDTLIVDKNVEALRLIKDSTPPFEEENFKSNLEDANKNGLKLTTDISEIKKCNVVIITLGTSSNKEDKLLFDIVIKDIFKNIQENSILILRSTIERGLLESVDKEHNPTNKGVVLAYCPERLAEGFAFEEIETLPQIVGTKNESDFLIVKSFFEVLGINSLSVNYKEAEFIKLFINTYRYSQFSLLNSFSNIAKKNAIDFKKVLEISKQEYPRLEGVPDSGFVGGPCLIKDSKTFMNSYDDEIGIINNLLEVNKEFMNLTVSDIKKQFLSKRFIQLGITFKPNSDDLRDSQSLELYNILLKEGFEIEIVEPNIKGYKKYNEVESFSDNVLISTFHDEFKNLDFSNKKVIVIGNK